MGQSRPLFVYFCSFLITISIQIEKNVDCVLGIRTQGRRMVGADETKELWRPPSTVSLHHHLFLIITALDASICHRLFQRPGIRTQWSSVRRVACGTTSATTLCTGCSRLTAMTGNSSQQKGSTAKPEEERVFMVKRR